MPILLARAKLRYGLGQGGLQTPVIWVINHIPVTRGWRSRNNRLGSDSVPRGAVLESPRGSNDKPWVVPVLLYHFNRSGSGSRENPSLPTHLCTEYDHWRHSPKEVRKLMQDHTALQRWGPLEASLPEPTYCPSSPRSLRGFLRKKVKTKMYDPLQQKRSWCAWKSQLESWHV